MKRAGIIGHPVAHSLSPVFQGAAFAACGLDVIYERWDTPLETLGVRVASVRWPEVLGANVTVPHKEAVLPFIDELGGLSARIGAVNTLVNREGRLFGFNTDGPGFVAALRNEIGYDCAGRSFLLLGAGGAARGIAFALLDARAASVTIQNRSLDRAQRLARDLDGVGGTVGVLTPADPWGTYHAVVNTTSVGMHGGPDPAGVPVPLDQLGGAPLVVDIVYAPEVTPLLRDASARGLKTFGGLPMLVYQGALAFELWTGVTAPVEVMFDAIRKELAARSAVR
jgi:shikimate dehydrogenase